MEVRFPLKGLHTGVGHQDQPPLTSFSLLNVMPLNVDEERMTGGQRPGLTKAFSTQVAGAYPILQMAQIVTTYIEPVGGA